MLLKPSIGLIGDTGASLGLSCLAVFGIAQSFCGQAFLTV